MRGLLFLPCSVPLDIPATRPPGGSIFILLKKLFQIVHKSEELSVVPLRHI